MDKDQADKAAEAVKKVTDKHADDFAKLRDVAQEERPAKTQELTKTVNEETLKAVGELLKPEQMTRLQADRTAAGRVRRVHPPGSPDGPQAVRRAEGEGEDHLRGSQQADPRGDGRRAARAGGSGVRAGRAGPAGARAAVGSGPATRR